MAGNHEPCLTNILMLICMLIHMFIPMLILEKHNLRFLAKIIQNHALYTMLLLIIKIKLSFKYYGVFNVDCAELSLLDTNAYEEFL